MESVQFYTKILISLFVSGPCRVFCTTILWYYSKSTSFLLLVFGKVRRLFKYYISDSNFATILTSCGTKFSKNSMKISWNVQCSWKCENEYCRSPMPIAHTLPNNLFNFNNEVSNNYQYYKMFHKVVYCWYI